MSFNVLDFAQQETRTRSFIGSAMFGRKGTDDLRHKEGKRDLGLGWLLYAFTRVVRPQVVLECGSGGSSFCILAALRDNGKGHLHTIDPFEWGPCRDSGIREAHARFLEDLESFDFTDLVTFHHCKSEDFFLSWHLPVDLLVVDGDHSKETVHKEWEHFSQYLRLGSYAFFHDPVALPEQIGSLVDVIEKDEAFSCLVEPDYLGMIIAQRKFKLDETGHKEVQALHDGSLTDARGISNLLKQRKNEDFGGIGY